MIGVKLMKRHLWNNLLKNIGILVILFASYAPIYTEIAQSSLAGDKAGLGSLLVAVSLLSVAACFGNFAFTYEKVNLKKQDSQLIAHVTTGLLMLLIGLSLEMTSVVVRLLMGNFVIFDMSLLLLYIASIFYDFWDLHRASSS